MRILGLDIGQTSVRAVELEAAFGRYEMIDHYEHLLTVHDDAFQAAGELVLSLRTPPDKIAVALRTEETLFRNLMIPTRDRKAIRSAVAFELEDEVPFDMEDGIHHFAVLNQNSDGTHVHIATTLRERIAAFLEKLQNQGIDPEVVTTEGSAFRILFNRIFHEERLEKSQLLVDIGYNRTVLYAQSNGVPILCRAVDWGGNDITAAISDKYKISYDEAERAKLDSGFVLTTDHTVGATPDQLEFSDTIYAPIRELISQVKQSNLTFKKYVQSHPGEIFLAGASALLPGLRSKLEEDLKIPVYLLESLSRTANARINYSKPTDATFGLAAGLALSLMGTEKNKIINLRREEFGREKVSQSWTIETAAKPIFAMLLILICAYGSQFFQSMVYDKRMKAIDNKLQRGLKTFFPDASRSALRSRIRNPSKLKEEIKKRVTENEELAKISGKNPRPPLGFLKSVSSKIPKSSVVDLIEFQVGSAPDKPFDSKAPVNAKLTMLIQKKPQAESIKKLLGELMDEVKGTPPKEAKSLFGDKGWWRVTYTGKPKENSYGR